MTQKNSSTRSKSRPKPKRPIERHRHLSRRRNAEEDALWKENWERINYQADYQVHYRKLSPTRPRSEGRCFKPDLTHRSLA